MNTKNDRRIYLSNTDIEEAVASYFNEIDAMGIEVKREHIDIREGLGRVTSRPVFAKVSSPNHNAAAMDGIMVIAQRTFHASEVSPVVLELGKDFAYINTGHLMLSPYDGVIMIEDVEIVDDNHVRIFSACSPWQHVRPIGEDIVSGEMIVFAHHTIRPMDIGAILSGGVVDVDVFEKIRVGIIPTGTEITDNYEHLEKGKIFDTNSWTFKSLIESYGGIANRVSPVEDTYDILKEAVSRQLEDNHIVIINAGSSAGSKDYTASIIEDMGEVVLHGIAIKPGKPTVLGLARGKAIIGIPGYPGSAYLVFEEVVEPLVRKLQRTMTKPKNLVEVTLSRRVVSSLKYREYIRVTLGQVGKKLIATPLNRGAGVSMTLVRSHGVLTVPKTSEGYEASEQVMVELTSSMEEIQKTMVSIGSHDLIMDMISSMMGTTYDQHLSSAHVGSMGGIMAMKRGEAHMAPIHLLDEETGIYNERAVAKYLGDDFVIIKGVQREQGIMTAKGNPKGIGSIEDIGKKGIVFVNRQKGSGTRILVDYLLKKNKIQEQDILGYHREMTTHMAVAAAIHGSTADAGVGVLSAAKAMDLDFIPIGYEDYDFVIRKEFLQVPAIQNFMNILKSQEFMDQLKALGGYGY